MYWKEHINISLWFELQPALLSEMASWKVNQHLLSWSDFFSLYQYIKWINANRNIISHTDSDVVPWVWWCRRFSGSRQCGICAPVRSESFLLLEKVSMETHHQLVSCCLDHRGEFVTTVRTCSGMNTHINYKTFIRWELLNRYCIGFLLVSQKKMYIYNFYILHNFTFTVILLLCSGDKTDKCYYCVSVYSWITFKNNVALYRYFAIQMSCFAFVHIAFF